MNLIIENLCFFLHSYKILIKIIRILMFFFFFENQGTVKSIRKPKRYL